MINSPYITADVVDLYLKYLKEGRRLEFFQELPLKELAALFHLLEFVSIGDDAQAEADCRACLGTIAAKDDLIGYVHLFYELVVEKGYALNHRLVQELNQHIVKRLNIYIKGQFTDSEKAPYFNELFPIICSQARFVDLIDALKYCDRRVLDSLLNDADYGAIIFQNVLGYFEEPSREFIQACVHVLKLNYVATVAFFDAQQQKVEEELMKILDPLFAKFSEEEKVVILKIIAAEGSCEWFVCKHISDFAIRQEDHRIELAQIMTSVFTH